MKDQRLYGRFTLDFPDSAKIMPLSDAAFRCLVEATLWSRRHQTDGWLPSRYAVARWSLDVLRELASNDSEKPSLIEHEHGWQIHDFAAHQDTKVDIDARRERNKLNGQKGGLARGKRVAKRVASNSVSETQAETETETETDREVTTDVVTSQSKARLRTRVREDYMPARKVIETIKAETNTTDAQLRAQHQKFIDYWLATGKVMADWDACWRKWMRTANERGELGTSAKSNGKTHKLRALADLAAEVREMETANERALEP